MNIGKQERVQRVRNCQGCFPFALSKPGTTLAGSGMAAVRPRTRSGRGERPVQQARQDADPPTETAGLGSTASNFGNGISRPMPWAIFYTQAWSILGAHQQVPERDPRSISTRLPQTESLALGLAPISCPNHPTEREAAEPLWPTWIGSCLPGVEPGLLKAQRLSYLVPGGQGRLTVGPQQRR